MRDIDRAAMIIVFLFLIILVVLNLKPILDPIINLIKISLTAVFTGVIAIFTLLTYSIHKKINRPVIFACLDKETRDWIVRIENLGNGVAWDGKIECRGANGCIRYSFLRLGIQGKEKYLVESIMGKSNKVKVRIVYYGNTRYEKGCFSWLGNLLNVGKYIWERELRVLD